MTITLPDELKDGLERKAHAAGFATILEYLTSLAADTETDEETDLGGPPELTPRNRAELEAMILAGINSGPGIPATPEFWEERRRVLEEKIANRNGGAP